MRSLASFLCALAALLFSTAALAHGTRSASIEITEIAPGRAVLHVRTQAPGDEVTAHFDAPCMTSPADDAEGPEATRSLRVECPGSIAGATLSVEGLGPIVTEAIVLFSFADGRSGSRLVGAAEPSLRLPEAERGIDVASSYVGLGVRHILTGYDHLLFLLSLVLLLRRPRAVLAAETAFTVSHSLSFSAAALGWVHVSPAAAEACIALSLVLVALDIGKKGARPTLLSGATVAFVFGLIHGLGFAGGLSEIGLPDHDVSLALAGFATGVELGQVAFLAVALLAVAWIARLRRFDRIEPAAAALVGGVASYWLIERVIACFAARA
jgi:HupE / UreJ protein